MISRKLVTVVEFLTIAVLWSLYFVAGCFIWHLICTAQPSVYMDEIFHAGQCKKFCQGNFYDVILSFSFLFDFGTEPFHMIWFVFAV